MQQAIPLTGIAWHKTEMQADALQGLPAGLCVVRIGIDRERSHAERHSERFDHGRREGPRVGQKRAVPAQRTELDGESPFVDRTTALVHLVQIRWCQSAVLAQRIGIAGVGQALGCFPILLAIIGGRGRHAGAPPKARTSCSPRARRLVSA
jgi:hypothetical protein